MGRPMGVIVLAVALLVGAVFHFIVPFTDFGIGSWLTATSVSREHVDPAAAPVVAALGIVGLWIALIGMILAGVMLIAMRGLWTFATWGWWLTVACLLVGLALNVIPMMAGIFTTRISLIAVFDASFLAYLFTPQIRSFYTGGPPDVSVAA